MNIMMKTPKTKKVNRTKDLESLEKRDIVCADNFGYMLYEHDRKGRLSEHVRFFGRSIRPDGIEVILCIRITKNKVLPSKDKEGNIYFTEDYTITTIPNLETDKLGYSTWNKILTEKGI